MRAAGLIVLSSAVSCVFVSAALAGPPVAEKRPVTDTYHGTGVVDDYQWLEDWSSAEVKAWSDGQNAHARTVLDGLPNVAGVRARISEILSAPVESYFDVSSHGDRVFALKRQPPRQQPFLVVFDGDLSSGKERVLVDPNKRSEKGTTAIDWFVPSPDGKTVAVSMSEGGSESGDLHLFDAATGEEIDKPIARVQGGTAGGSVAWLDDTQFLYTRYPRDGEKTGDDLNFFVQIHKYTVGKPDSDSYEFGSDFPKIAEIVLDSDPAKGRAIATVQLGDGGKFSVFYRSREGFWRKISGFDDGVKQAFFGGADDLFMISFADAPRGQVMSLPIDANMRLELATVVVGQAADSLVTSFLDEPSTVAVTKDRLFLTYQTGGPSEVRAFTFDGRPAKGPEQLPVSTVNGLSVVGDALMFNNVSFVNPAAWYRFDPATGKTERTGLATNPIVNFDDCEVVREFATSKDGTKVPVNIIKPRNAKLDGSNALVLNGYGGYGVNITPAFSAVRRVMLEQGVIYAVANIRGGGEYGEEWHLGGNLLNKQHVFDDFAAVARHLVDRKYTSSERLGIIGGSNGGLLMGATFTQNPALMKAVVSSVGIYDMLRVELSPNGAFNVPEFGTVTNPAQFAAMYAYSPYHRVKDGTAYPSILFLTGANDPRVDPMHSRKMTARLQAASPGSAVLLRTSADSGHGLDTSLSEQIAQQTDIYSFLFKELGVSFKAVK